VLVGAGGPIRTGSSKELPTSSSPGAPDLVQEGEDDGEMIEFDLTDAFINPRLAATAARASHTQACHLEVDDVGQPLGHQAVEGLLATSR